MSKAVILIGGPQKGTRFRPLSFDIPKPLFNVAGVPTIQHLIEACIKVPGIREILIIGFYNAETMSEFLSSMKDYKIKIRYLQEYTSLGTGGGIFHFRDQIQTGDPEAFFVINGDVCGDFPLVEMRKFHQEKNALITVLGTEATHMQSQQYGCIVKNNDTNKIVHYVEKPSSFVSTTINCGVYICSPRIYDHLGIIFKNNQLDNNFGPWSEVTSSQDSISLEQDVLMKLAGKENVYVFSSSSWWSQMKTAGSAIYANRHYLDLYHSTHPDWLAKTNSTIGDVFIHPTAKVHPSAILGPNVSIGKNVVVKAGVRIKESIVLGDAIIFEHALVLHSIIGWNSSVGRWARVEGTPCDPNPDKPFTKMENVPLFNETGRLNPSITVLGCNVHVPSEVIVLNSIVLPHKDLTQSYKNQIIL
ncbi:mannose-1-phosphate guanyltransferase alpha-B [Parasteatoda tepidariorum]|nr:mannose-1-phosphate guanyltransferase alpha-B [Parasteatoda tepidariorum]